MNLVLDLFDLDVEFGAGTGSSCYKLDELTLTKSSRHLVNTEGVVHY